MQYFYNARRPGNYHRWDRFGRTVTQRWAKTSCQELTIPERRKRTRVLRNCILYTRTGCHLCDEAYSVLQQHGLTPELIDIDTQPALRERFDACVPVVEMDGKIRFRGRVDPVLLRRLLARERG